MKNLFKNFAVLASVAVVAASFTSCHRASDSSEETPVTPVVETTVVKSANTLVVKLSNNIAKAQYNGKDATATSGTVYTWTNADAGGAITVVANAGVNIVPVNPVVVAFGNRNTLVYEIDVQKVSAGESQAAVESGTEVTNDKDNQDSNDGAKVSLKLPTGVKPDYKGATGEYSLTLFVPAQKQMAPEDVQEGTPLVVTPYAVNCEPSGADFPEPGVHTEINIEGIEEIGNDGILFQHDDGTPANRKAVNGNTLSGDLPHFSVWNVIVNALCTGSTEGSVKLAEGNLSKGTNAISYDENCGVKFDVRGVLATFVKLTFGASYTSVPKTATINAQGTGTYVINQKTYTKTFKAGKKTFSVTVYGEVTSTTSINVPVPTHNGGSN